MTIDKIINLVTRLVCDLYIIKYFFANATK